MNGLQIKNGNFYTLSTLFQGVNDVVDCGSPADVKLNWASNEITLSLWFRPTSLLAVSDLIGVAAPFAPTFGVLMGVTAAGELFGYFGSVGKTMAGAALQVVADTWYHAALTIRNIGGTYTANIWLNGVKQGTDVTAPGSDDVTSLPFRIGSSYVLDTPDVARPFTGQICQATAWSVGFTSAEVNELRQGGKPGAPKQHSRAAALIHHWPLGTTDTYPVCRDRVGAADGTCTGMVSGANNFVAVVP